MHWFAATRQLLLMAGWQCSFDFDWISGRWAYNDNGGQCSIPIQETVDGVIIEGSREFIDQVKGALDLIKSKSSAWYTLAINGALKIREAMELCRRTRLGTVDELAFN